MGQPLSVECVFMADGRVRVRRVRLGASWHMVEQGRQWVDESGRHVLLMLPGEQVTEIVLSPQTLNWEIAPQRGPMIT